MDLKMNLNSSCKNLLWTAMCKILSDRLCTQMNSSFFLLKVLRHVTEQRVIKCE